LKLQDAIHRKCPFQLARVILLHHDNASPHTAQATQERIQEPKWELPEHSPYSVDLASSDFHLFDPLKDHLGGRRFADDREVEMEVWKWLRQQSKNFMLRVSAQLLIDGTNVSMLVEDMLRNKFASQIQISHVLHRSICDLFTDSSSYCDNEKIS
jgi:hypothetical protein